MKKLNQAGISHLVFPSLIFLLSVLGGVGFYVMKSNQTTKKSTITNFEECVAAGYPIMESYPEQCNARGQTFVKQIK